MDDFFKGARPLVREFHKHAIHFHFPPSPMISSPPSRHSTMASKPEQRVRSAALARDTNETRIVLAINLDGGAFPANTDRGLISSLEGAEGHATQASKSQAIAVNSGIGFLDHMLHALAKHAGWSLALNCKGDLHSMTSLTPPHCCP